MFRAAVGCPVMIRARAQAWSVAVALVVVQAAALAAVLALVLDLAVEVAVVEVTRVVKPPNLKSAQTHLLKCRRR